MRTRSRLGTAVLLLGVLGLVCFVLFWMRGIEIGARDATANRDGVAAGNPTAVSDEGVAPVPDEAPIDRATVSDGATDSPVALEPFGTLVVHVRWGRDQAPAPDVGAVVLCFRDPDPYATARLEVSGADGSFRCERVAAGKGIIHLDRCEESTPFRVEPGAVCEVTAEIPPGALVEGVVLGPGRLPFSGADVLLFRGKGEDGFVVARSGADGTFVLRDVSSLQLIGARAPGFAPSYLPSLNANAGATHHVELLLEREGGAVSGVVLGSDGMPIAGANVRLSVPSIGITASIKLPDGTSARREHPQRTTTDDRGSFAFGSATPGDALLEVRAPHYAPWKQSVTILAGTRLPGSPQVIRLVEGVRWTGRVLDSAKLPIYRAEVKVGLFDTFDRLWRFTDDDGAFAFDDLPVGPVDVIAEAKGRGRADAQLFGVAGQELRQDLVLSDGLVINARVVDEQLQPLANYWVLATSMVNSSEVGSWVTATSDADGRVRLLNCQDTAFRLVVHAPDQRDYPRLSLANVRPGRDEIVLRVPRTESSARIVLTVLRPDRQPVGGAEVRLAHFTAPLQFHAADGDTGRCVVESLPAGIYQLAASAPGFARWTSPRHDLKVGETWDLGEVILTKPGSLLATLIAGTGESAIAPEAGLHAVVTGADSWSRYSLDRAKNQLRSEPLPPGKWTLQVQAPGIAAIAIDFTIAAGSETLLDVPLAIGEPYALVIREAVPTDETRARITVSDSAGRRLLENLVSRANATRPWAETLSLAPGTYRVVVDIEDSRNAVADIVVDRGSPHSVELILR